MKILFKNASILDFSCENCFFTGDLLVENEKIAKVDKNIITQADKIYDCNESILMSGFINCRVNSCYTLFNGIADDLNKEELFESLYFRLKKSCRKKKLKQRFIFLLFSRSWQE